MQNLIEAEARVRQLVRRMMQDPPPDYKTQADAIAGDIAAQCYHYLTAVAHAELAIQKASHY